MKSMKSMLMGGAILLGLAMCLTSCEGTLDDVFGEWSRPSGNNSQSNEKPSEPTMKATPLTLEAITAGTIVVNNPKDGMQYSKNGGAKTAITDNPTEIAVAAGDKVAFYGNGTSISTYSDGTTSTKIGGDGDGFKCKVYGNIMSLVDETGYEGATELTGEYAFCDLFKGNTKLTDISDLQLPATTLKHKCYQNLFQGCTSLTNIPEALLPAPTLATYCYSNMFNGCASLTTVPEKLLPATTLANACYENMFEGCTSLTNIPEKLLPATTLADNCYEDMFNGCTSLTTVPEKLLPATTLAQACYFSMFCDCKGLTTLPEKLLPATEMKLSCYAKMFSNCTVLTTAPELPATTLTNACYWAMFSGCSNLIATPHLAAPTSKLVTSCYESMFWNCTSLTKAYVMAEYKATDYECSYMFSGCTATGGTFYSETTGKADDWRSQFGFTSWTSAVYSTE